MPGPVTTATCRPTTHSPWRRDCRHTCGRRSVATILGVGIVGWIVVGLVAGALAGRVTGVRGNGCLFTMVIGVIGGLVGGALFAAAGDEGIGDFGLRSMFVAFVGATVLLLITSALGITRPRR